MKYRYPFKAVWLPALLLTLCLSTTLISTLAWLISAAANDSTDSYTPSFGSIFPALLMLATWIGCAILARHHRLHSFLWFSIGFWGLALLVYLACLTPLFDTALQVPLTIASLPLWSFFALVALIAAQNQAAQIVLTILPMGILITVFSVQLYRIKQPPTKKAANSTAKSK